MQRSMADLPNANMDEGPILGEQAVHIDEMSCLNLTISAPKSQ
jgi:hypothetical protein